jgi:endonuclease/exonuclease/phosphatase (EEP) superfamily protein YafD
MPNLLNPSSPRFEGRYAASVPAPSTAAPLRAVTFNIKFAREIERAIEVLESDSLRDADVLMLQEMDDRGVDRIARALGLNYAYYPATVHPGSGKYFGPAVLSRWPIERSWKVLLPHEGWGAASAAPPRRRWCGARGVGAGLRYTGDTDPLSDPGGATAMADAGVLPAWSGGHRRRLQPGDRPVPRRKGYRWVTGGMGPTVSVFSWDHIFARGVLPREASAGVVREVNGASDHRPVWAVLSPASAVATAP